jgi:hypothetical protein
LRASTGLPILDRVIEVPMTRLQLLLAAALAALPAAARSADDRPAGTIDVGSGRSEVLSKRLPVGQRIDLPEGWFRVEEEGVEDGQVGSFTIVSSSDGVEEEAPRSPPVLARAAPPPEPAAPARAAPTPARACRAERNAYLRQLWKESGIDVSDPDALIEGLDAGTSGPATGYYWFALATDAFRNLSSSSDLRDRAGALVRCVQAARDAAR